MKKFSAFFVKECKRFLCRRNLAFLLVIALLVVWGGKSKTSRYKKELADSKEFQKFEELMFKKIMSYDRYSVEGVDVLFLPAASTIFFACPAVLSQLSANIDTIIALKIVNNCKSKTIFSGNSLYSLNFSNIVLLPGSILALFFGFGSLRKNEYLKMLSSNWTTVKVYMSIILTRGILLTLTLLFMTGIMLIVVAAGKVALTASDFSGLLDYLAVSLLMLLFFFFAGVIAGRIRSKVIGIIVLVAVPFIFLEVIPGITAAIIDGKSTEIPSTVKVENDKLQIINEFEKKTEKKYGKFSKNNMDVEREIVEGYWNDEYKRMEALELNLKNEIARVIASQDDLSAYFPTTFYISTCNEASSRGYLSYLEFYGYLIRLRRELLRFWIDRVYYNDPKIFVSFVKGNENLFTSKSRRPGKFAKGVSLNLGYVILLMIISYLQFYRSMHFIKKETLSKTGKADIKFKKGDISLWKTEGDIFKDLLYNLFSGNTSGLVKKGFKGRMQLDNLDIVSTPYTGVFRYICRPEDLPKELRVRDFVSFFASYDHVPRDEWKAILDRPEIKKIKNKTVCELKKYETLNTLLTVTYMKKSPVYIINDAAAGMPFESSIRLKDRMDELVKTGALVVYLYETEMAVADNDREGPEDVEKQYFVDGYQWLLYVEANRRILATIKSRKPGKKKEI